MLIPPSVVRDEGVCNLGPSALEQLTGIAAAGRLPLLAGVKSSCGEKRERIAGKLQPAQALFPPLPPAQGC